MSAAQAPRLSGRRQRAPTRFQRALWAHGAPVPGRVLAADALVLAGSYAFPSYLSSVSTSPPGGGAPWRNPRAPDSTGPAGPGWLQPMGPSRTASHHCSVAWARKLSPASPGRRRTGRRIDRVSVRGCVPPFAFSSTAVPGRNRRPYRNSAVVVSALCKLRLFSERQGCTVGHEVEPGRR